MTFKINGEYNTATVHTKQPVDEVESGVYEQIEEMANAPAFVAGETNDSDSPQGDIHVMPDFHWGKGAVIGFTMPVKNRVVPNTIGVDIGCGMYATKIGTPSIDDLDELDSEIRARVPTGFDVHDRNDYHMIDDFPWDVCQQKLSRFERATDFDFGHWVDYSEMHEDPYPDEYFTELCERVGYDMTRAINSVGTLGGGNHFIELAKDSDGATWCVIHSGSRGIGASIAQYWQEQASQRMNERALEGEIPDHIAPYLGDDWKPRADKIREEFNGKEIQEKFNELSQYIQSTKNAAENRNTDLDYLEGEEAHGYIRDMIFAQTYASESRKQMMDAVSRSIDTVTGVESSSPPGYYKIVESVHNYIDFNDGVIRKGACAARAGDRVVIPFNMKYGTIIARGKGNESWNNSAPHGAGRAMGRREAKRQFTDDDFTEQTDGVHMSETPLDEIPGAYKDPELVERALGPTVTVEERLTPFLSIKDN